MDSIYMIQKKNVPLYESYMRVWGKTPIANDL